MSDRRFVRCINYEDHMATPPSQDVHDPPVIAVEDMAVFLGWRRIKGYWYCKSCVNRMEQE